MLTLGKVLAQQRSNMHYTQKDVARILNEQYSLAVKPGSVSTWEKDQALPNARQFLALCKIYRIDNINEIFHVYEGHNPLARLNSAGMSKIYDYANLLIGSGMYEIEQAEIIPFRRNLPLYHLKASAGTGQYIDSDAYEMIDVGSEVSPLADFGVTLAGDSMEPLYVNGQTVWVHKQDVLNVGDIGIFYYAGNAYCKKYHIVDGQINLVSVNKGYKPIRINEDNDFRIFGKVVG